MSRGISHVNVGSEEDTTIFDMTRLVARVVGFKGDIVCDLSKPDGTPRKLMSGARLRALGGDIPSIWNKVSVRLMSGFFATERVRGIRTRPET
jgi:nucleoside-diphosphate-sugar epimerase